jgi:hypothetical protein
MMNDEYLWNKAGRDAETEALEDALSFLRYKETAAPALPAKVFALPETRSRRLLRLGFAFAATAFAATILMVVWFQMPSKPAKSKDSQNVATAQANSAVNQSEAFPPSKIEVPSPNLKTKVIKIHETRLTKLRPVKTIVQQAKLTNPSVKLTKDEEYAYDQLMLALSITSSKLKIVKDKVDGIDQQDAATQTRR